MQATVWVWEAANTREVKIASFSPDGMRIVTASNDGTARVWEGVTGRQLAVLEGHVGPVHSAAWSPDGVRVVTASGDKTARLWRVSSYTDHLVQTAKAHLPGAPQPAPCGNERDRLVPSGPY
jgi:WD40 repeat protein